VNAIATALKVIDPFVVALTGLLSYYLRFDDLELPDYYRIAILVVFALLIVVFAILDVYRWRPDEGLRRGLARLVGGWFGIVVALVVLLYATRTGSFFSRQWLGVWSTLAFLALILERIAAVFALRALHRRGLLTRRIAICGAGRLGQEIARRFSRAPETGVRVVAFYDDAAELVGTAIEGVTVRGTVDDLSEQLREHRIDQVWIALPLRASDRVTRLLQALVPQNVKVRFVPDIFGFQLMNHSFTEICGLPVVNISESPLSGFKGTLKWLEDKLIAFAIVAIIWPLLLVIAIGIKLGSPGPVLFRQRRGGLDNREFIVWKFRTMTVHDEKAAGEVPQARRNDPRITPFGAFLRRTSLDELPQFINVLKGDMSIVGPRPHPLWLNDFHRDKLPRYMLRSWIKPGITGWAQVCGWRGETDELWKMDMRVQHDLYYIENWSLGFDLYIILITIFRLRSAQAY
jgi:putative colanic acid biosynthesis UDP-glucose lipid carrier transferase